MVVGARLHRPPHAARLRRSIVAAIASADANVRRVAETVARLDPDGEEILFVVGSDHGMESVAETIDLMALLIEAGLKRAPGSSDVVVAPNGTAALLYFAEPESALVGRSRGFSKPSHGSAGSSPATRSAEIGLPTDSPARIATHLEGRRPVQPLRRAGP